MRCPYCGGTNAYQSGFTQPYHGTPYSCDDCDERFEYDGASNDYYEQDGTGIDPVFGKRPKCDQCSGKFDTEKGLKIHGSKTNHDIGEFDQNSGDTQ